jgi:hypothetical protein
VALQRARARQVGFEVVERVNAGLVEERRIHLLAAVHLENRRIRLRRRTFITYVPAECILRLRVAMEAIEGDSITSYPPRVRIKGREVLLLLGYGS